MPMPFDAAQVQSLAGGSCVLYRDGSANCLGMYRPMQIATDVAQIVTLVANGGAVYCVLGRSGGVRCGPEPLEGRASPRSRSTRGRSRSRRSPARTTPCAA